MHPLSQFGLFGTQPSQLNSDQAQVFVSLSQSTCMAEVTGDLVAILGCRHCPEAESTQRAHDLLASPKDLEGT